MYNLYDTTGHLVRAFKKRNLAELFRFCHGNPRWRIIEETI